MTLPRQSVPLALLAVALSSGSAAADPVPLLHAPNAQEVGLAGADVIVASAARGGVTVDAVAVRGGARRRLLTVPPGAAVSEVVVAASPQRVAVLAGVERVTGVERRLYSGPPGGPLQLVIDAGQNGFFPVDAAVDGDRVLVVEESAGASRARLFVAGAAPRVVPWPGTVIPPVAFSATRAAFVGTATRTTEQHDLKLFVIDVDTGAAQVSVPVAAPIELALAPDGHVVAEAPTNLFRVAPGRPRAPLPGSDFLLRPRFAGLSVAAFERTRLDALRPAVLDPLSATRHAVGIQSYDTRDIAADAQNVAWIAHGCVVAARVGSTASSEPPAGPCPRSEATVDSFENTLHGRRVRLRAVCVAAPARGCRGAVVLRHGGATVGRARFHVASDRKALVKVRV